MILPPVDPNLEQRSLGKPPLRDDTRFAAGKIAIFQYAAVAILLFLISGFWKLQVQNPEFYDERAQQNSIKSVPMIAPRGRILDRDGRVIVDNHSSFTLILAREVLKEEHLQPIAQGLDLDYDDLMNARAALPLPAQVRAHRHQGRTDAGRSGLCGFAPRLLSRAGADPRPAPPLSAERHDGARHRLHRRNQRGGSGYARSSPSTSPAP